MNITLRQMMSPRRQAGFSLIEMIGVLAIIAVLAVIIVPKVFSTIASARITSASSSALAMKSAVTEFATKYGTLPVTGGTSRFDDLLIADKLLDSRFSAKIGTPQAVPPTPAGAWTRNNGVWAAAGGQGQNNQTRMICIAATAATTAMAPSAAAGGNYRLNGNTGANPNLPVGSRVVSVVIVNVTGTEARELSLRIDGDAFSAADTVAADNDGKVVYAAPNAAGTTTAYIYIAHQ